MTALERALLRFLGLWAVVAGVELLERVAYRAGAADAAGDVDLDDELEPVDLSDVVWLHFVEFHAAGAPQVGECTC